LTGRLLARQRRGPFVWPGCSCRPCTRPAPANQRRDFDRGRYGSCLAAASPDSCPVVRRSAPHPHGLRPLRLPVAKSCSNKGQSITPTLETRPVNDGPTLGAIAPSHLWRRPSSLLTNHEAMASVEPCHALLVPSTASCLYLGSTLAVDQSRPTPAPAAHP